MLRAYLIVRMAFGALLDRPARTALTLLGIVIGIVALVAMTALIQGLERSAKLATRPLGAGVFQIQKEPRFGRRGRDAAKLAQRKAFELEDVEVLRERLELTEAVGAEMWQWGVAIRTNARQTNPICGVGGATESFMLANGFELESGRFLQGPDIENARNVAVIGADVVKTLFPQGWREALGSTIRLRGRPYTVVGTMKERPALFGASWRNAVVAIPVTTFERSLGFRSLHVTFVAKNRDDVGPAVQEAIATVRAMRNVKPGQPNDFEHFTNETAGSSLDALAIVMTIAALTICLIALIVGGVGVMNIMLVAVTERTREIGVKKALGARPRTILAQFLIEAVALTTIGGVAGVVLADLTVRIARAQLDVPAEAPAWVVGLALASSTIVGLIAGSYPAARAARLPPIEALRYE